MTSLRRTADPRYSGLIKDLGDLLESARRAAVRAINAVMTATYWEIGRRIVEFEQGGERRAEYGAELLETLAADLTRRFGRGFSRQNLQYMRQFYVAFPPDRIRQTASGKSASNIRQTLSSKSETLSRMSTLDALAEAFPLPWSHYVLLIGKARSHEARAFYHAEAMQDISNAKVLERLVGVGLARSCLSGTIGAVAASMSQPREGRPQRPVPGRRQGDYRGVAPPVSR